MPILFTNVRPLPSLDTGVGGAPFLHLQPIPGFALIGLTVRAGDWIDQVTPVFAEVLDDGTLGPELPGLSSGGPGGAPHELRVAPGHLVTGIQTRSGSFVDAVRLLQSRWDGASLNLTDSKWTPWVSGSAQGGAERPERLIELTGTAAAIGIAGRAGLYLDSLTLIGAEMVRVTGTVVPKNAGRSTRSSAVRA